tara:strand:- start:904 stop:1044 length:141 start_codon:yes stop_codon:yes gene_type:complete
MEAVLPGVQVWEGGFREMARRVRGVGFGRACGAEVFGVGRGKWRMV